MQIRMDISDSLYNTYKELADKSGYAVTKLNQIIFEKALQTWIVETEKNTIHACDACGTRTNKPVVIFDGRDEYIYKSKILCEECYTAMLVNEQHIDLQDNQ